MKIEFTKDQYESLIKLVYLGNWMINAIRVDDRIKKFDDLEQYIYSSAKEIGLDKYIEYDTKLKKFFPTKDFEENSEVSQYMDEYDNEAFWDGLVDRLARRDFIREYREEAIRKMSWQDRMEKESPFIEKYEEEFEKYGIDRLEIKR